MTDNYVPNKALDKTKEMIGIEKFEDIKILIDTNDKLPDDITSLILMTRVIAF